MSSIAVKAIRSIPVEALERAEYWVLHEIAWLTFHNGEGHYRPAQASLSHIAQGARVSLSTARRAVQALEAKGYISRMATVSNQGMGRSIWFLAVQTIAECGSRSKRLQELEAKRKATGRTARQISAAANALAKNRRANRAKAKAGRCHPDTLSEIETVSPRHPDGVTTTPPIGGVTMTPRKKTEGHKGTAAHQGAPARPVETVSAPEQREDTSAGRKTPADLQAMMDSIKRGANGLRS